MMYSIHHAEMFVMGCVVSQNNESETAPGKARLKKEPTLAKTSRMGHPPRSIISAI
jgi:hypothetical protein